MCAAKISHDNFHGSAMICPQCDFQHFTNLATTGSALITRAQRTEILLVRRARDPKKGTWDIAGGFCEPHEHPEETVKREVKEELSIEIQIEKLWGIYSPTEYIYQGRKNMNCDIFYLATIISGEPTPNDDVDAYQWFSVNALPPESQLSFDSAKTALKEYAQQYGK